MAQLRLLRLRGGGGRRGGGGGGYEGRICTIWRPPGVDFNVLVDFNIKVPAETLIFNVQPGTLILKSQPAH